MLPPASYSVRDGSEPLRPDRMAWPAVICSAMSTLHFCLLTFCIPSYPEVQSPGFRPLSTKCIHAWYDTSISYPQLRPCLDIHNPGPCPTTAISEHQLTKLGEATPTARAAIRPVTMALTRNMRASRPFQDISLSCPFSLFRNVAIPIYITTFHNIPLPRISVNNLLSHRPFYSSSHSGRLIVSSAAGLDATLGGKI
ncbi:hypothetical protein SISNIDRAFT_60962 [Sistotremastrum niveocremeum HHB9708]|uniref:Uncharacterized protein n=1 Tax=Sistotremastrum niveocremeum HHB9708 TaxID=1314777 RepID=A0A164VH37_9AGAM|nr:hypothetical protein SISNIDRAFT_60962 [Sistotremastrum niveocremeum HHB9708]